MVLADDNFETIRLNAEIERRILEYPKSRSPTLTIRQLFGEGTRQCSLQQWLVGPFLEPIHILWINF